MNKELVFTGMDVHAKNITIALAQSTGGSPGEARLYGTISNELHALERVFAKLKRCIPDGVASHKGTKSQRKGRDASHGVRGVRGVGVSCPKTLFLFRSFLPSCFPN